MGDTHISSDESVRLRLEIQVHFSPNMIELLIWYVLTVQGREDKIGERRKDVLSS